MTCIYDVLLNFTDDDNLIDFFEWQEKDTLEHIKKIYLVKVNSEVMDDFLKYKIKVTKEFLEKIEDKTCLYKNKKNLKYAALFTDMNKVIAFEFSNKGEVIAKSSLLLDEEDDIMMECACVDVEEIQYEKICKYPNNIFLTREELFRRKYLLKEVENAYKDKLFDKILYYYEEIFDKDEKSINDKYKIIINDIKNNYNEKHDSLYEIVRMSYSRK